MILLPEHSAKGFRTAGWTTGKLGFIKQRTSPLLALLCCALLSPPSVLAEPTALKTESPDYSQLTFEVTLLDSASAAPAERRQQPTKSESVASAPANTLASSLPKSSQSGSDIDHYQTSIDQILAQSGPFSIPLREQYESLGLALQKAGEHERAVTAFESALHIDRVNNGLFTPQQIPLVRNIIASYVARANWQEAARRHEYLYLVQKRNYAPNSSNLLAAQEELADWNVLYYFSESTTASSSHNLVEASGKLPWLRPDYALILDHTTGRYIYVPRSQLPAMLEPDAAFISDIVSDFYAHKPAFEVPPEAMVDERLRSARDIYQNVIANPNSDFHKLHDLSLEYKLANVGIAVKRQLDAIEPESGFESNPLVNADEPADSDDNLFYQLLVFPQHNNPVVQAAYARSRDSLQAIADRFRQEAGSDSVDAAMAYINLGDWHLYFNHPRESNEAYEQALQILAGAGLAPTEITQLFNPAPLVPVPAFAVHPYSKQKFGSITDGTLQHDGHVDLRLTLTQSGMVKAMHIIDSTPNTSRRLRQLLLNYLHNQPMRPWVVDGKLAKASVLDLRIHYSY